MKVYSIFIGTSYINMNWSHLRNITENENKKVKSPFRWLRVLIHCVELGANLKLVPDFQLRMKHPALPSQPCSRKELPTQNVIYKVGCKSVFLTHVLFRRCHSFPTLTSTTSAPLQVHISRAERSPSQCCYTISLYIINLLSADTSYYFE